MSNAAIFLLLAIAAILEAGGDALVRYGVHGQGLLHRAGLIALGGLILTLYGIVVNAPSWDFGRLLGVYVTLFFLAAQTINVFVFKGPPSLPIIVGGSFIIAGGMIMTFWRVVA
jgi:small multidrug resistance family-3 protein